MAQVACTRGAVRIGCRIDVCRARAVQPNGWVDAEWCAQSLGGGYAGSIYLRVEVAHKPRHGTRLCTLAAVA
jgi:hypothetical protein